jgi:GTPase SAR1 family protein
MSEKFAQENKEWLHDTPYFKWANEADAFVFVIDLARYLDNRNCGSKQYVIKMSKAIRAAWQHLLDNNQHRISNIKEIPVVLVFNKSDLFAITSHPSHNRTKSQQIAFQGLGKHFPTSTKVYKAELEKGQKIVCQDFADLINYLKGQSHKTSVLFVSSVADSNRDRLNLNELLHAVLPS